MCCLGVLAMGGPGSAASPLVRHELAARHGLQRAWFAQIPLDPQRSQVRLWLLDGDRFFGVTTAGLLTSLDSRTGAAVWTSQIGRPGLEAFGPGANARYVAAVSGSKLYLLDREDGRMTWSQRLGSAPASGPALTRNHAYVALMNGQIEGYLLDDPGAQPWYHQSKGRTFQRPTTTGAVVSWPTDTGLLYVSSSEQPRVLFRLVTNSEIVTSPTEQAPYLYIASLDGYLYCIHELTGVTRWRYSTGSPIDSSPAVVGKTVYVASTTPTLHAIDNATGRLKWWIDGIADFAAESETRVYAQTWDGQLAIIDKATGGLLSRLPLAEGTRLLVNNQTDRIFLVRSDGLVQCLHEIGSDEPFKHVEPSTAEPGTEATKAGDEQPATEVAAPDATPQDAALDEQPAETPAPAEAPANDTTPDLESNPFGDFGF
jgi:outer membrane protein assembly factor BamB